MRYDDYILPTIPFYARQVSFDWEPLAPTDETERFSLRGSTNRPYGSHPRLADGADYDYITDESYSYDDNGNRVLANGDTYTTGDNNETTFDGTYRYSYDAEGNQTEKYLWTDTDEDGIIDESEKTLVQTCSWDYRNRLESVTNYDSSGIATETIEYIYDYLNQMIARSVISASTSAVESSESFVYSNGQIVLEYDTTSAIDAVTAINLWGANVDELVAVESATNNIQWSYGDHLNTIRDVVSYNPVTETTTVINHLIFDAFGNLASSVDPSQSTSPSISPLLLFRYTGKFFDDATGLQNNLNRWYDSTSGKWISVDPIGFNGGDVNLYRYVGNASIFDVDLYGYNGEQNANFVIYGQREIQFSDFSTTYKKRPLTGTTDTSHIASIYTGVQSSHLNDSGSYVIDKSGQNDSGCFTATAKVSQVAIGGIVGVANFSNKLSYFNLARLQVGQRLILTGRYDNIRRSAQVNRYLDHNGTEHNVSNLNSDAFNTLLRENPSMSHILEHENGHFMIAHIAALFLKKELSSLEITSCAATEEDAKALALEGIQKEAINITKNNHDWLVKTQRDYDDKLPNSEVMIFVPFAQRGYFVDPRLRQAQEKYTNILQRIIISLGRGDEVIKDFKKWK